MTELPINEIQVWEITEGDLKNANTSVEVKEASEWFTAMRHIPNCGSSVYVSRDDGDGGYGEEMQVVKVEYYLKEKRVEVILGGWEDDD